MFSGDKNRNKKNIEKLRFFQREKLIVLIKNLKFFHLFIFGKIRKENVFDNILETKKKLFYTMKNKKLKSPKIGIFPKGLLHGFGQKFENFPSFYYWQNQPAKCV